MMQTLRTNVLFMCSLAVFFVPAMAGTQTIYEIEPLLAADDGGIPGYQHSFERSRFRVGGEAASNERLRNDLGFAKVIGPDGVFATDIRTGLVIATMSNGSDKDGDPANIAVASSLLDYEAQNAQVLDYFVDAGIPRDQIGGVHANTYLSASGNLDDPASLVATVDGYASILDRVIDGDIPVADSVAWARLDAGGEVMTEWVYWPAIPGAAIANARRLKELLSEARDEYLAKLPEGVSEGMVIIHHTPGTEQQPFEALATYDVIEHVTAPEAYSPGVADTAMTPVPLRTVNVRHFDLDGEERAVPAERHGALNVNADVK